MDSLEETPISDISDTYLSEEQFNKKYPMHPIDVSTLSLYPTHVYPTIIWYNLV